MLEETAFTQENPYGAWIKPCGTIVTVVDVCDHYSVVNHTEAFNDGWVRVVWGVPMQMCGEFNSNTVTLAAFTSLVKAWRDRGDENMSLEDHADYRIVLMGTESRPETLGTLRKVRTDIIIRDEDKEKVA
jgi:hypothetical protein